jgi:hypothetical protein
MISWRNICKVGHLASSHMCCHASEILLSFWDWFPYFIIHFKLISIFYHEYIADQMEGKWLLKEYEADIFLHKISETAMNVILWFFMLKLKHS